ncbi:LuxR C-terminal-related transcriptional regulator [Microvirga yunnanensis]|uniref:LuxR C-terminal-related transcriptional regulator n=1 Tax=Microvirga yunnanensis TaxID=2953740 RepID=UPI0021C594E4|nr:response regulator transcription factor [Microvirga sp. HBU65207]
MRSGLQNILQRSSFALTEAASPPVSGRLHPGASPALVLIEAQQNASRWIELVRQVKEQFPQARIVVLSDQFDLSVVRLGHAAGVDGFCLTASAPEVLIKSLELVMLGETVLPLAVVRSLTAGVVSAQDRPPQDNSVAEAKLPDLEGCKLSAREMEILGCLTQGEPNKVIARKLEITEATIKVHVKAILRKIGASNRTQAAMWASQRLPRRGVLSPNV